MELAGSIYSRLRSLVGKRPRGSIEDGLDGRPNRRRRTASYPLQRPPSTSTSKQSSMTGPVPGGYTYYDKESGRFFEHNPTDSPPRSANPVADLPEPDDDIVEVPTPPTQHTTPTPHPSHRTTRSSLLVTDNPTARQAEDRLLGYESRPTGLWRSKAQDATLVPDPEMSSKRNFHTCGPFKPVNTLNAPTSSKAEYVNSRRQNAVFNARPCQSSTIASPANGFGRGPLHRPSFTNESRNSNPPYKKPRLGPSPMEGKSIDSAIPLDDSQEHNELKDDQIQSTPETKPRSTQEPTVVAHRGDAAGTRNSARKQHQNGIPEIQKDDVPTIHVAKAPKQGRRRASFDSMGNKCVQEIESEDEKDLEFTKEATRQRKAEATNSSPERRPTRAQNQFVRPSSTTNTSMTGHRSAPSRRPRSLSKHLIERDGSQSPDVLQEGITTTEASLTSQRHSGIKHKRPTDRLAPSLADSIVGNANSTIVTRKQPKLKGKQVAQESFRFRLKDVRYQVLNNLPPEIVQQMCFVIHPVERSFYFDYGEGVLSNFGEDSTRALTMAHELGRIVGVRHGTDSSVLLLTLSKQEGRAAVNGPIGLDVDSHKNAVDLIQALQLFDQNLSIKAVPDDKIGRMFQNLGKHNSAHEAPTANATGVHDSHHLQLQETPKAVHSAHQKPPRLIDKLDKPLTIISFEDRRQASRFSSEEPLETERPVIKEAPPRNNHTSNLSSPYFDGRATRAQSLRSATAPKQKFPSPELPKVKFSSTGGLGEPWKHPLVYPKEGKKRESISFDELWRLDDDEFLNDTLISFFLRYLQHRTEVEQPDLLKKMHFFNSYFFDSLNKGTKGAKNINYEAVARWTRAVDLFSRDFVIVPVNENLHWFVAIICNLPYLKPKKEDDAEEDGDEPDTLTNYDEDAGDQGRRTKQTQQSFEELSIDDRERPTSSTITSLQTKPTTPKGRRSRKKKFRRSLPRHDTTKPIIITLDSLGVARSVTCSVLKQYIVREAKDKLDFEISEGEIKGMTAKSMPTQGNYSDCGLYMCMYLEQFIHDPYHFVAKLLQREESEIRWPIQIRSEDLRTRMRDLILELHRQQEGEKKQLKIPELGKILVDMREASPAIEVEVVAESPPPPPLPDQRSSVDILAQKRRVRDHYKQLQEQEAVTVEDDDDNEGFQDEADEEPISESSQKRHAAKALALVDAPIVIEDDGTPKKRKKRPREGEEHVDGGEWMHERPGDLARKVKAAREYSPRRGDRAARSGSVDTAYLSGIRSYEDMYEGSEESKSMKQEGRKQEPQRREGKRREPLREIESTPQQDDEDGVEEDEELEVQELPGEVPETQSADEREQQQQRGGIENADGAGWRAGRGQQDLKFTTENKVEADPEEGERMLV